MEGNAEWTKNKLSGEEIAENVLFNWREDNKDELLSAPTVQNLGGFQCRRRKELGKKY